ncbi:MAG: hypothetical protein AAGG11_16615 [Pseudomonadota bacterium]
MKLDAIRTLRQLVLQSSLLLCVCLLVVPPARAAEPGLREELGAEQFEAFGLSRLTAAELARLEAWLAAGRPAPSPAPSASSGTDEAEQGPTETPMVSPAAPAPVLTVEDFGDEQIRREERDANLGERFRARIQGSFEGWEGKTLFRLDNGQIWRQRIGGRYRYRAESPTVEIVKGRFGYYLEVVETGRQVGVRRIR